jgi:hypothetical protein
VDDWGDAKATRKVFKSGGIDVSATQTATTEPIKRDDFDKGLHVSLIAVVSGIVRIPIVLVVVVVLRPRPFS